MVAPLVPREMATWACTAVLLSAIEGGLVGVMVKNVYSEVADPIWVNLAVAVAAGAPAFANLMSFLFASIAQGRHKVRLVSILIMVCSLACLVMAAAPFSQFGLLLMLVAMITARASWSGVITIRSSIWRMNYPRHVRARITGSIVTLSGLLIAAVGAGFGLLLDWRDDSLRVIYPLATVFGLYAAYLYRKMPVRRQAQLLAREQTGSGSGFRIRQFFAVLAEDRKFRRYMMAMMVFGCGNLMMLAPLIIVLNEHFNISQFQQVVITASLPLFMVAVSVSVWARLLDRRHILEYRAIQSWGFVSALAAFALAAVLQLEWMFWVGSVIWGIAFGGAILGWNLGHNDFSKEENSALYMGVHVTLTGVRGLVMPAIAVLLYQWVSSVNPAYGPWVLVVPFVFSATGAVWFVVQARQHRREQPEP